MIQQSEIDALRRQLEEDIAKKHAVDRTKNRQRVFYFGVVCILALIPIAFCGDGSMGWAFAGFLTAIAGAACLGLATEFFEKMPFNI